MSQLQLLAPVVVSILKQASDGCPPAAPGADIQITPALLQKEAAYNAVGAAYYDLHDYIDFKSWCVIPYNGYVPPMSSKLYVDRAEQDLNYSGHVFLLVIFLFSDVLCYCHTLSISVSQLVHDFWNSLKRLCSGYNFLLKLLPLASTCVMDSICVSGGRELLYMK